MNNTAKSSARLGKKADAPAVSRRLLLTNRQRSRALNLRQFRSILVELLRDDFKLSDYDLSFVLVNEAEMTRANETFLRHAGSTDVITFDYHDAAFPGRLAGEILICVDEAELQARRYRSTWQQEVVRYAIHGILHLAGYDDHRAADRRCMKREEDRLVRLAGQKFPLARLAAERAQRRAPRQV